jgi:hypothetical protein
VDERDLARANAIGRLALGAGLLIAPALAARGWIGGDASSPGTRVVTRALAIRDVALGAGLLWALDKREPVHAWITGAAAVDAVDAAATLAGWSELPRLGRAGVVALATGSAVQMGLLARASR